MIRLNSKTEILVKSREYEASIFYNFLIKRLSKLKFKLVDEWYEIESSSGEIENTQNLRLLEIISRSSFIKKIINVKRYRKGNNFVTIRNYYLNFDDLIDSIIEKTIVSIKFSSIKLCQNYSIIAFFKELKIS